MAGRRGAQPCSVPPRAAGGSLRCGAPFCSCPMIALTSRRGIQCAYAGPQAARPLPCPAISDPLPSGQREHGAEQFARQRSLSAPPLCPGPLALSCPLSARPLHLALPLVPGCGVSGLLSPYPLSPSIPSACTVQSNVRGNPPTHSLPCCPLVSWSPGKLHAFCTAHYTSGGRLPSVQSPCSPQVASSVAGHPCRSCPWSAHSSRGVLGA